VVTAVSAHAETENSRSPHGSTRFFCKAHRTDHWHIAAARENGKDSRLCLYALGKVLLSEAQQQRVEQTLVIALRAREREIAKLLSRANWRPGGRLKVFEVAAFPTATCGRRQWWQASFPSPSKASGHPVNCSIAAKLSSLRQISCKVLQLPGLSTNKVLDAIVFLLLPM
jgi:hypothetical protein